MNQDELFSLYCSGDDLGASYSKYQTKFALFSPLAVKVVLLVKQNEEFVRYEMNKDEYFVYRYVVKGDLLNVPYFYEITFEDGHTAKTNDPYAKGTTLNSVYSAVVDIARIKRSFNHKVKDKKDGNFIYEVNIRDFTEDKHTDIVNKGKYLGFVEKHRKTNSGHKAGLDYLIDLGISHVQLNPVIDFANVDDINYSKQYNWGYDPISFFNLEGSYSISPEIPMERLFEFKKMVYALHKAGIKVIMDVVYNHIFDYPTTVFEKSIPGYYFRKDSSGNIANGSGCGNEFATERPMVRKMILDSIKYFVEVFDVDGFRFDLMGLIDVETINQIKFYLKSVKPSAFIYGEGWNMGNVLPYEDKACLDNATKLNGVGFFNDLYRDALNGNVFDRNSRGFIMGANTDVNHLKYLLFGLRFTEPKYSINYIECHDNMTIYDRICKFYNDNNNALALKRVKLANAILALSFGTTFIHMGQEIGQSKCGLDNTYNVPKVNNLAYKLLDERIDLLNYFKDLIALKKQMSYLVYLFPYEKLNEVVDIKKLDDHAVMISVPVPKYRKRQYSNLYFLINNTNERKNIQMEDYCQLLLTTGGVSTRKDKVQNKSFTIPPISLICLGKKA